MSSPALILLATETASEPAIHPYAVGGITLGLLLALLFGLIAFGGGREHS